MYYNTQLYRLTFHSSALGQVSLHRCANSKAQAIRDLRKSRDVARDYGTLSDVECERVRRLEGAQ